MITRCDVIHSGSPRPLPNATETRTCQDQLAEFGDDGREKIDVAEARRPAGGGVPDPSSEMRAAAKSGSSGSAPSGFAIELGDSLRGFRGGEERERSQSSGRTGNAS